MTTLDTHVSVHSGVRTRMTTRDVVGAAWAHFSACVNTLLDWQERARQRRQLLALSDRALQDFGASRADADHEGTTPAWHQ